MAKTKPSKTTKATLEARLFAAANLLRKNINAAEYKHVVLGLVFLKYISNSFEELHTKLSENTGEYEYADPEDRDEYTAQNIFWVPHKRAGRIFMGVPDCRLSARNWIRQWKKSKRKTPASKVFYQKSMKDQIFPTPLWVI